jgi:hypothetical protein
MKYQRQSPTKVNSDDSMKEEVVNNNQIESPK